MTLKIKKNNSIQIYITIAVTKDLMLHQRKFLVDHISKLLWQHLKELPSFLTAKISFLLELIPLSLQDILRCDDMSNTWKQHKMIELE
ncbi:MAG TPA: hypothetical protein DDW50_11085 [Firmicutes bacterium]|jgi:hypothetical protein|nr:hypothetical protein [Bacillota bacterium]